MRSLYNTLLAIKIATPRRRHATDVKFKRQEEVLLLVSFEIQLTVSRIWNQWVQDDNTERRVGSQRPSITGSREDRHVTRMALSDRVALSRALSQALGSFARQKVFAQTVRRRLPQHELSARRSWLRLPLTLHHRQERLQWCDQRRTWTHEWPGIIFSDESKFSLQHQDSRIRIWWHHGELT
ncbi:transposable element Tc1 transposase [Trichonephila clavipes]|nr:transposable element Tc1 transposase [Trichonephila clavipes]